MDPLPRHPDWIVQIMPADGWCVVLLDSEGEPWTTPLACWALVESDHELRTPYGPVKGARRVLGMVGHHMSFEGSPMFCEDGQFFVGYCPIGTEPSDYLAFALEEKRKEWADIERRIAERKAKEGRID
jgi:hypothetical protein